MRPLLLETIRTASTLLLGLYAGGVFFVVVAPSLGQLPGPAYVRYWQALNNDYGRAMPPFLLTCLALVLITCVLSYRRGWLVFGITAGALTLVLFTIVLTVTQMEPINHLANSWDPDLPPADWTALRQRWLTLHAVRAAIAVLAFAGLLTAQLIDTHQATANAAANAATTANAAVREIRQAS